MKRITKKIVFATLILLPYYGFSQSGYTKATDLDVKGVFIGGKYTKSQVEAKWGTSTKYRSSMSEFGLDEVYDYSDNQFLFSDSGIFNSFFIKTSNFSVYTAFSGGIKVGDNISRVQTIGLGTLVLQKDGTYRLNRNNKSDDSLVFKHTNGVITQISFVSSI